MVVVIFFVILAVVFIVVVVVLVVHGVEDGHGWSGGISSSYGISSIVCSDSIAIGSKYAFLYLPSLSRICSIMVLHNFLFSLGRLFSVSLCPSHLRHIL